MKPSLKLTKTAYEQQTKNFLIAKSFKKGQVGKKNFIQTAYITCSRILQIFIFLIFMSVTAKGQTPVNTNGGFEDATLGEKYYDEIPGWELFSWLSGTGTFEVVDDPVKEGTRALCVEVTGLGTSSFSVQAINFPFPVEPNTEYTYSIWAKSNKEGSVVSFLVEDPSYNIWEIEESVPMTTEWKFITFTFTTPDTATSGRAPIRFSESANDALLPVTFYIDNLQIVKSTVSNDVGVLSLNLPGISQRGQSLPIDITIKNFGTQTQSNFPVSYSINGSTPVTENFAGSLPADSSTSFTFAEQWNPQVADVYHLLAWTDLTNDENQSNNTAEKEVTITSNNDVGVLSLNLPNISQRGQSLPIKITVKNFTTQTQSNFPVSYSIDGGTPVTENFTDSLPGDSSASFTFAEQWNPQVADVYHLLAWTDLTNDENQSNDTAEKEVTITPINDVGVLSLNLHSFLQLGQSLPIKITVKNFTTQTQSNFPVSYSIDGGTPITENFTGSLPGDSSASFTFAEQWNPQVADIYHILAWTDLTNDEDQSNDTAEKEVTVTTHNTETLKLYLDGYFQAKLIPYKPEGSLYELTTKTSYTITYGDYFLTEDISGNDYTLNLLCASTSTTDFTAVIKIGNQEVVNTKFSVSGAQYKFYEIPVVGIDPDITGSEEVELSITINGEGSGVTSGFKWGDGTYSYIEIPYIANPVTVNRDQNLPDEYCLYQNYPNPFNPITTIVYKLAQSCQVDLSIYNLRGQKVMTLVSEQQTAGYYTVEWNASDHESGVYLCKLRTDKGFVQTQKLVLLK